MNEPLAFLNGRIVPAGEAQLPVYDAGIVLGATVTELTRTFRLQPFRLGDHLDRLVRSLRYVGFDIGMSRDRLAEISLELIAHNGRLLPPGGELGLIQFATAGEYPTYAGMAGRPMRAAPTICVHTFPLPLERWAEKMRSGAHLVTPAIRQLPPQCCDPKIKCRSRMHYHLADQEARLFDPDAMALLLNLEGKVTETSAANFLIVQDGSIVSPTLSNILPGISRQVIIELAGRLEMPFIERDFQVLDAINAVEALLTSTPYCLMPVTRINGIAIGHGKPGPVFARLSEAWSALVGLDIRQQILAAAG